MASISDVANYILTVRGSMTAMKLQKLCYYCQAWSLVWDERPLFEEHIEAWANGPVSPALFDMHRGLFKVDAKIIKGDPENLDKDAIETIEAVLSYYGDKASQWLSELTHSEAPWRDARIGLMPGERGDHIITYAAMQEYYESLLPGEQNGKGEASQAAEF
jgi:uncharacterized phage-associated protein